MKDAAVLYENPRERVTQIQLARLKKEKHFGRLATFRFGTFAMLFSTAGCVVCHENTRR